MSRPAHPTQYYKTLLAHQYMSFLNFLLYGWFVGILGFIFFYPAHFFMIPYFGFYLVSYRSGINTARNWRKYNVRRCFGATMPQSDYEQIRKLWFENSEYNSDQDD